MCVIVRRYVLMKVAEERKTTGWKSKWGLGEQLSLCLARDFHKLYLYDFINSRFAIKH